MQSRKGANPDIVGSAVGAAAPMRSMKSSERLEQLVEMEKKVMKSFLDHFSSALENPKVELLVATIALSCAVYELAQDFEKIGSHHSLALISSIKVIKLILSILKESKNASKTLSKTINIKQLN
jgi:hypothetical protein